MGKTTACATLLKVKKVEFSYYHEIIFKFSGKQFEHTLIEICGPEWVLFTSFLLNSSFRPDINFIL